MRLATLYVSCCYLHLDRLQQKLQANCHHASILSATAVVYGNDCSDVTLISNSVAAQAGMLLTSVANIDRHLPSVQFWFVARLMKHALMLFAAVAVHLVRVNTHAVKGFFVLTNTIVICLRVRP